jgi:hypothetical protein
MTARERLKTLEQRLKDRGVTDIHLDWAGRRNKPLSQVTSDVCDVIEAFLDGKYHPLPDIGDSVREQTSTVEPAEYHPTDSIDVPR